MSRTFPEVTQAHGFIPGLSPTKHAPNSHWGACCPRIPSRLWPLFFCMLYLYVASVLQLIEIYRAD